jgi:predicted transcriptional regulator
MQQMRFITNHGQVLLRIAHDPDARLREIGGHLGITERRVYDIVSDLVAGGYVVKFKKGRRNSYEIQDHLTIPGASEQSRSVGELLLLLTGSRRNGSD